MGWSFRLSVIQRRKKKRSRRPEIPMDVVMAEIVTRLPAKSLMRFKCVSKVWSSLICSRYLSNRFLTVPSPRLYMCFADITCERTDVILSAAPNTASCFVVDHDLTIPRRGGYISQKLGGFMCYSTWRKMRIYNPATRQLVRLPAIKSDIIPRVVDKVIHFFFGHDPVNDQYKAICTIAPSINVMPEHWVFVLNAAGGGSWKKAAPTPPDLCPHLPDKRGGLCVNGVIYYLARTDASSYVLVSFHVRSEEFKMIQVPRVDGELPARFIYASLIEYGGKVTLVDQTNLTHKGMLDLWFVEDVTNKQCWSRKTLVLQPSQLHLVNNIAFKVRSTTQNGKVLLIPRGFLSSFHILCYDLQSNDIRKIDIKGVPDHWFSMDKANVRFDVMFMDRSESIMHLET